MNYLRKLHSQRAPSGLEWKILKRLPMCLLGGIAVPSLLAGVGRLFPPDGTATEVAKKQTTLDIFSIAIGLTSWSAILTVGVGCIVVIIMKGPAYVADGYSPDDPKYQP